MRGKFWGSILVEEYQASPITPIGTLGSERTGITGRLHCDCAGEETIFSDGPGPDDQTRVRVWFPYSLSWAKTTFLPLTEPINSRLLPPAWQVPAMALPVWIKMHL
jgi:hypothetical protein